MTEDQRVVAITFLSTARALLDCAIDEITEDETRELAHDARRDLEHLADVIMEPLEIERILDTIDETMQHAMTADREAITRAAIDARRAGLQDETRA